MDFASYRADLMRYRADLEEVEQLRTFLRTMVDNLEQIVRRDSVTQSQTSQRLSAVIDRQPPAPRSQDFAVKGSMPFTQAVLQVLRDARGEPLKVSEILRGIEVLGARSDAKRTDVLVNNSCNDWAKKGQPLEKVAMGTWRWAGPTSNDLTPIDLDHDQASVTPRDASSDAWHDIVTDPEREMVNHA